MINQCVTDDQHPHPSMSAGKDQALMHGPEYHDVDF